MRRLPLPRLTVPVLVYLLVASAVAALAVSLGFLLHRQGEATTQTGQVLEELQEQNRTIKGLLEAQARNDRNRQQLIDDAVSAIAAEQYRALVAHDRRTEELLRRNTRLLGRVNGPASQPQRALPEIPQPAPRPQAAPAPPVGPPTGVRPVPAPAPQPAPAPCQQRGKSGKCKK